MAEFSIEMKEGSREEYLFRGWVLIQNADAPALSARCSVRSREACVDD